VRVAPGTDASSAADAGAENTPVAGPGVTSFAADRAAAPSSAGATPGAGGAAFPAALAQAIHGGGATGGAVAAPAEVRLGPPIDSPGFAPALGAQLRLMLRDGISEARLQLNPAEMGPVSVRIHLDGSQARVDLAAERAPTRQALEQALPTLAGALRDSGLTLTGGGVFEQPQQPPHANGDTGSGDRTRRTPTGPNEEPSASPDPLDALGWPSGSTGGHERGVLDVFA
jgi:flagellar hook-length control protein FliK